MIQVDDITDQACLELGRTMLVFGLKYSLNLLQTQVATLEQQLVRLQPPPAPAANGKIRPAMERTMALIEEAKEPPTVREAQKKSTGQALYWAQFTPEERKKEMKRRARTRRRREAAAL